MTITEMREKRAKLWATMEGFLDTHRNEQGVLSAEDDHTYSQMENELDLMTNEVKLLFHPGICLVILGRKNTLFISVRIKEILHHSPVLSSLFSHFCNSHLQSS